MRQRATELGLSVFELLKKILNQFINFLLAYKRINLKIFVHRYGKNA